MRSSSLTRWRAKYSRGSITSSDFFSFILFFVSGVKAPRFMLAFVVHWLLHFCALKKRFFSRARLSTSECLFTQTHKRRLRLPKHTQPSLAPLLPRPLRRFDSATISAKSKSKCRLNKTYSRAGERKKIVVEIFINYSGSDEAKGKLMN